MSEFSIKQATRVGVNPLICAYSESGCGKTMSALLLARGLAGPNGKVVVCDTESRRASLYADVIPGGFDTFELAAPFSPARYVQALETIWQSGAAVGVIDSGSGEWEGVNGVLDMAAEKEQASGKAGLHNWKMPKFEHAKFIQALLRSPIPLIVCLRAKYKSRQTKEGGKTVIIKDDKTSPIQAEDFIFEATCHFEILQNHSILLTKVSHPDLRKCFPADNTTPITIEHGRMLAAWCAAPSGGVPVAQSASSTVTPPDETKALKSKLWGVLKAVRGTENKWDTALVWLASKKILSPGETLNGMDAATLKIIIEKAEIAISETSLL